MNGQDLSSFILCLSSVGIFLLYLFVNLRDRFFIQFPADSSGAVSDLSLPVAIDAFLSRTAIELLRLSSMNEIIVGTAN